MSSSLTGTQLTGGHRHCCRCLFTLRGIRGTDARRGFMGLPAEDVRADSSSGGRAHGPRTLWCSAGASACAPAPARVPCLGRAVCAVHSLCGVLTNRQASAQVAAPWALQWPRGLLLSVTPVALVSAVLGVSEAPLCCPFLVTHAQSTLPQRPLAFQEVLVLQAGEGAGL